MGRAHSRNVAFRVEISGFIRAINAMNAWIKMSASFYLAALPAASRKRPVIFLRVSFRDMFKFPVALSVPSAISFRQAAFSVRMVSIFDQCGQFLTTTSRCCREFRQRADNAAGNREARPARHPARARSLFHLFAPFRPILRSGTGNLTRRLEGAENCGTNVQFLMAGERAFG